MENQFNAESSETVGAGRRIDPNLGGIGVNEGVSCPNYNGTRADSVGTGVDLGGPNFTNSYMYNFGRGAMSNPGSGFFGGAVDGGPSLVMDPYGISREIDTGKSIVKRVLTGRDNYVSWKVAMEIALSGRSQLGFVRGEYPKPNDPVMAARWQKCNDIIMSWLISSVSESIGEQIMRSKDVVTAWNSLKMRYGGTNLARKSVLLAKVSSCAQGDSDVSAYFDRLSRLWQELDAIREIETCDSSGVCNCCRRADKEVQEDRVVRFLIGLNDAYAVVRSNIFAMSQVPNIDKVYDMVSQEETQKNAKRGVLTESSAMYGNADRGRGDFGRGRFNGRGRGDFGRGRSRIQCTNCQMTGHTKENCYKLIGYPSGWKMRDVNRPEAGMFNANKIDVMANNAVAVSSGLQFTNEQVDQLSKMLEFFKGGNLNQSQGQLAGQGMQDNSQDWGA